ncbi:hypothetical protein [Kitasatospora sp. NPDC051705]|uniref:hypothetical protein n=1 Tax=Kitasatospora sp. NPDC051705 TaxID=3364057 RepID=UPI00379FBF82
MTSLHPTATDPTPPGPPADGAGTPAPHAGRCAVTTAAEAGPAGAPGASPNGPAGDPRHPGGARPDSVPRPRGSQDALPDGRPADEDAATDDPTTSRLRAALAERLRAAHAQGRSVSELAAACRRPVAEVRALLGGDGAGRAAESDGVGRGRPAGGSGGVDGPDGLVRAAGGPGGRDRTDGVHGGLGAADPGSAAVPAGPERASGTGTTGYTRFPLTTGPTADETDVPVLRAAREDLRGFGSRRPSPSRRLRRMHPESAPAGPAAVGPAEPAAPAGLQDGDGRVVLPRTGEPADAGRTVEQWPAADPGATRGETPLGILISGSPLQPEAVGRPEERAPVRVTADTVRLGRGTSLVVLPSWRPAIAVSVPTDRLLAATGLTFEQLAGAQLTVLMNPAALHDRELDLHGWEAGPGGRARRGGRP